MRSAFIFFVLLFAAVSGQAIAEKRVALVIGNSAYQHAVQLANPKNDSSDMTAKLESLGFQVVSDQDLDLAGMRRTVRNFLEKIDGADMALFFYAGHGLQVNGNNYLVPVDARLSGYNDLDFEALPMDLRGLGSLFSTRCGVGIYIPFLSERWDASEKPRRK